MCVVDSNDRTYSSHLIILLPCPRFKLLVSLLVGQFHDLQVLTRCVASF